MGAARGRTGSVWGPDDIVDLTGRVAIVTGATSGVGYETAVELAAHGAHVLLACRDEVRAAIAADQIVGNAPGASLDILPLDLADPDSVRRAAAWMNATQGRLDLLVNNAGIMATPFEVTPEGIERQVATNHLGHFALTGLLLDLLTTTMGSRVVTVSSVMRHAGRVTESGTTSLVNPRSRWLTYGNTKLANLVFTAELDRRLRAAGSGTRAIGAHPGWARTHLIVQGPALVGSGVRRKAWRVLGRLGQSAEHGALPVLYAATAPEMTGGEFVGPAHPGHLSGPPRVGRIGRRGRSPKAAERLWRLSESLTGVRIDPAATAGDERTLSPGAPRDGAGRSPLPG